MKTERLQAVVTTGIYCRASCSAQPLPKNVRPVASPVAAEAAGYRPCLRCRSDRVAVENHYPSDEVTRAVALISEGFLDRHREVDLAQAVGYSARQLRRLFEEHVGATPDFVARSRRAHFARRLLDETQLTVTEIAYASGFNSLRQMNRVVKEIFAFTPSELRARRRRNQGHATDGGLTLSVEAPPSAEAMLRFFAPRATPGVESVEVGTQTPIQSQPYRRTIVSCGHPGVLEIAVEGAALVAGEPGVEPARTLRVTAHLPTYASLVDDIARVKQLFGTRPNMAAEQALMDDPMIGSLVAALPGLRMPGAWDRFEAGVRIIIGQQISVKGATTITGRLAKRLGKRIDAELPPGLSHTFPGAEDIAEGDLSKLGLTRTRETTLRAFAQAVASGDLSLVGGRSLDDLSEELEALPGIGPWSSQLIAARAFGHADAFPASDLGLRKAAAEAKGESRPLSTRELQSLAEAWRPYRATAAAHLWFQGASS